MKTNKLLIPIIALLLTSCSHAPAIDSEEIDNSKPSENITEITTENHQNTSEENSSKTEPNSSEDISDVTTDKTTSEITSEEDTSTEKNPSSENTNTSEETNTEIESSSGHKPAHPDYLPNGAKWLSGPKNLAKPLDISKTQTFNIDYGIPDNWSYIYGNNKTRGDWYVDHGKDIALKFGDEGRGLQTPAFTSSLRMEIELVATEFHGTDVKRPNDKKDTFLVYGFNDAGDIVHTQYITPFKKGVDKNRKQPLKIEFYIENPDVRYAEIRLNERLFNNEKNQKYVNFGVSEMSLRAWVL